MECKIKLIDALDFLCENEGLKKENLCVAVVDYKDIGWQYADIKESEVINLDDKFVIILETGTNGLWKVEKNRFVKSVPNKIGDRYVVKNLSLSWIEKLVDSLGESYKSIAEEGIYREQKEAQDAYVCGMENLKQKYVKLNAVRDGITKKYVNTKNKLDSLMDKLSIYREYD